MSRNVTLRVASMCHVTCLPYALARSDVASVCVSLQRSRQAFTTLDLT